MRYLLLIMMSLLMGAANADWFTPVANDQSMLLINALFPGLTGAGGADSLVGAMGIFNGAVLMMGGVLATYTLLAGTLGTAHDGEMLGKKFSSVWIPIICPWNCGCLANHRRWLQHHAMVCYVVSHAVRGYG